MTLIGLPMPPHPFVCWPGFQEEPKTSSDSFDPKIQRERSWVGTILQLVDGNQCYWVLKAHSSSARECAFNSYPSYSTWNSNQIFKNMSCCSRAVLTMESRTNQRKQ